MKTYKIRNADGAVVQTLSAGLSDLLLNVPSGGTYDEVDEVAVDPPPKDAEALARFQRLVELEESDWTQLPDAPISNQSAWASYRQSLRDLPDKPGWPSSHNMPPKPTDTRG